MASRYGLACQNADRIALTKLDVLSGMDQIPVITAYQQGGCTLGFSGPDDALTFIFTSIIIIQIKMHSREVL